MEKLQIYDCKKVMGRIAKKMIKTFGVCTKEVKANSTKEEFEKMMSVSFFQFVYWKIYVYIKFYICFIINSVL